MNKKSFKVLRARAKMGDDTIIELGIDKSQNDYPFIKKIRKAIKK